MLLRFVLYKNKAQSTVDATFYKDIKEQIDKTVFIYYNIIFS